MGGTSVHLAADQLAESATMPRRMKGETAQSNNLGKENIVEREPKGVVTVISPWNFPLNLSMRAVASAIAAGNSMVLKPATNTPIVSGLLIAKLFEAATVVREDGTEEEVPLEEIEVGDRMKIQPGEKVPTDGVAVDGQSTVDESMVTGESVPVKKGEGIGSFADGRDHVRSEFVLRLHVRRVPRLGVVGRERRRDSFARILVVVFRTCSEFESEGESDTPRISAPRI